MHAKRSSLPLRTLALASAAAALCAVAGCSHDRTSAGSGPGATSTTSEQLSSDSTTRAGSRAAAKPSDDSESVGRDGLLGGDGKPQPGKADGTPTQTGSGGPMLPGSGAGGPNTAMRDGGGGW